MKGVIFAYLVGSISFGALGQAKIREYFDSKDQATDSAKSTYYIEGKGKRVIDLSHPGWVDIGGKLTSSLDTLASYYTASGKLRSRELYYEGLLNGPFVSYHENGRIKKKGTYMDDQAVGYLMSWYPAGIPHQTIQYASKKESTTSWPKTISYWDSTGQQLVLNGNGYCNCFDLVLAEPGLREKGKVLGGERDSIWTGYLHDSLVYVEVYDKGVFKEGTRYFKGGERTYFKIEEQPEFSGGMEAMMKFIMRTMRYPVQARRMGTEGRLFVGFIVSEDGTITQIAIAKGISRDLDAEGIRVISEMPKWKPARFRGRPVRVHFVLPINFKLAD